MARGGLAWCIFRRAFPGVLDMRSGVVGGPFRRSWLTGDFLLCTFLWLCPLAKE